MSQVEKTIDIDSEPFEQTGTPFNAEEMATYSVEQSNKPIIEGRNRAGQFLPGVVTNPNGRPKGTKDTITKLFIDDLTHEWRNRGNQALQDLSSPELVRTCVAVLPKDVLLQLGQSDAVQWVINAKPLSVEEWQAEHGLVEGNQEDSDDTI
jgi:hypothetical protein